MSVVVVVDVVVIVMRLEDASIFCHVRLLNSDFHLW
jgi:hypothetical protein